MALLKLMSVFWGKTYGSYDTVAICLEVQQRILYDVLRQWFLGDIIKLQEDLKRKAIKLT